MPRPNTYASSDSRLYIERRDRQYVGLDIPATRICSLHHSAKCVTAMFCERPDLPACYPKQMYEELTNTLFADETKEIVYYAACLAMYRFTLLVSNSVIPQNMKRFKWHMLPVIKSLICGKGIGQLNSKQVAQSAQKIVDAMAQHSSETTEYFTRFVAICQDLDEVTFDRLKRQAILGEMLAKFPTAF